MTTDEQAIREVITEWIRASAAGDVDRLAALMDEDVVFLVQGREPMRGRDYFLGLQKSMLEQFRVQAESEIREIQVAGECAWCWSYLTVTITPLSAGAPVRRVGNILSVFRKKADGSWVLYRDANLVAAPGV